jgi:hypothetical protein
MRQRMGKRNYRICGQAGTPDESRSRLTGINKNETAALGAAADARTRAGAYFW